MLCQNCNKNEANVRYTEIINGEKRELILCEKCSKELGVDKVSFNMPIDFASFFGDMLEDYNDSSFIPMLSETKELQCDNCNMTYEEFLSKGKFGCSECYNTFSRKIEPLLKRIHGSSNYLGRKLNETNNSSKTVLINKNENTKENKLDKLQKDLQKAVEEERYEDAAKIRDKIKVQTKKENNKEE